MGEIIPLNAPDARGGLRRAEPIIDEARTAYPKVTRADFLLALSEGRKLGMGARHDRPIMQ